jgi:uncharacterized protein YggT (Ycf19 family)
MIDSAVVLDVVGEIQQFVDVFVVVYGLVILLLILASWFRLPYGFNPVLRFLHDVCDPYLNLFRRLLPPLGPFDLSPLVGLLVLSIAGGVLHSLLGRLH